MPRGLVTTATLVKLPATVPEALHTLISTCCDWMTSRLLIQSFSFIAEEAARCRGVLETCPHPGRKWLDHSAPKVRSVLWRPRALHATRCRQVSWVWCRQGRRWRRDVVALSRPPVFILSGTFRNAPGSRFVCLVLRALRESFIKFYVGRRMSQSKVERNLRYPPALGS